MIGKYIPTTSVIEHAIMTPIFSSEVYGEGIINVIRSDVDPNVMPIAI